MKREARKEKFTSLVFPLQVNEYQLRQPQVAFWQNYIRRLPTQASLDEALSYYGNEVRIVQASDETGVKEPDVKEGLSRGKSGAVAAPTSTAEKILQDKKTLIAVSSYFEPENIAVFL